MIEIDGVQYLTSTELADRLHVSPKTIRNWAYTEKLHAVHTPGIKESIFSLAEVEAFISPKPGKGSKPLQPKPQKQAKAD
jgi:transcriptional antiterminator